MRELKLKFNGQTRSFREDGTVAVIVNGTPVVKGKWRATPQSNQSKDNSIRYQIDNAEQPPVPVKYSFNDFNQLVAMIPAAVNGGVDSEPCVWLGKIIIDDGHDLVYSLLTGPTTPANQQITIFGDLHFDGTAADLVIDLAGGGRAVIKGEKGSKKISQLTIGQSDVPDFDAKDLLRFHARTQNDFPGLPARFPNRADIAFTGKWDIDPNKSGIVFLSKIAGTPSQPTIAIGFAGQFKAVTAGFAYIVNNGSPQIAFTVDGSHQWSSADASFKVSVGFSNQVFLANFSGKIKSPNTTGPQFSLAGDLTIKHEQGKTTDFALNLEGQYEFDANKRLIFKANVSSVNNELNYDLMLEGKFVFRAGKLNFQAKLSKAGPKPSTAILLAFEGNRADLQTKLALVLNITEDEVDFDFEFQLKMQFKGGVLIKDKQPKLLVA
ncbi:MAG: hypothetical protein L0Y58_02395 [Verrucomicrobia subdivision 3 bacterium]|nr:hypothetical protein [Limisphaerales bacterium]